MEHQHSGGKGFAILFGVAAVLFLMEYTKFPQQLGAALQGFTNATNPTPSTVNVPTQAQVVGAAAQIAPAASGAATSSVPLNNVHTGTA